MAKKENKEQEEKQEESEKKPERKIEEVNLIRILGKDIKAEKKILSGLTKIKGIGWAFANAICKKLKIDENKKIKDLSEEEIAKITSFVENPDIPGFLKNRRKDFDGGEDKHLKGADLDLRKEFDIKRLKKVRAYRGARHAMGLPVRGQRTRSNFRRNKKKSGAVGVRKKSSR